MTFRLLIECSKDIDKLHIDFSDGTSATTYSEDSAPPGNDNFSASWQDEDDKQTALHPPTPPPPPQPPLSRTFGEEKPLLDLGYVGTDSTDSADVNEAIIKPPEIEESDKPVNVAPEMQGLDL